MNHGDDHRFVIPDCEHNMVIEQSNEVLSILGLFRAILGAWTKTRCSADGVNCFPH